METIRSVLIIQEDRKVVDLVKRCVSREFLVTISTDLTSSLSLIQERYFDLVVLNTSYKTGNFLELLRRIKIETSSKTIFISSNRSIELKELCFENGCDDFLCMPFFPKELSLRIGRLMDMYTSQSVYKTNSSQLTLCYENKCIKLNSCTVFLSSTEFLIMEYLIKNKNSFNLNNLISYLEIRKNRVISSNSIAVGIKRLRSKLYTGTGMQIIKTRYGLGYYLSI